MNYDYKQTDFSKALLAGLFAGIIATLANLAYDYFFRDITEFSPSQIINVPSIIMVSTLLLTIAGIIFHFMEHYLKGGKIIYVILFVLVTAYCLYESMHVQRSTDPVVTAQFQKLLAGVVLITGVGALFIPYLYSHDKIYND